MKWHSRLTSIFSVILAIAVSAPGLFLLKVVPSDSRAMAQDGWAGDKVTLHAAGRGNPWINLRDGYDLPTVYTGAANLEQSLSQHIARPLTLAAGDFDKDGMTDLVAGYADSYGGMLCLRRGNPESLLSGGATVEQLRKQTVPPGFNGAMADAPPPFLPTAQVFATTDAPDFLGTGDFDGDGHLDALSAARGGNALYLSSGDGRGNLGQARELELPGKITAMMVGEINRGDSAATVAVGIVGEEGPKALVFRGSEELLQIKPQAFALPAEATALASGQLDDDQTPDVAVAAGSKLVIAHGQDQKTSLGETRQAGISPKGISQHSFSSKITSLAVGDFTGNGRAALALMSEDGTAHLMEYEQAAADKPKARTGWREAGSTLIPDYRIHDGIAPQGILAAARISSLPGDDLIIVDGVNHRMHILRLARESGQVEPSSNLHKSPPETIVTLDVEGEPVAALPMRLNADGLNDLVVLKGNPNGLTVALSAAARAFIVDTHKDGGDNNPADNICAATIIDDNGNPTIRCTLRAAIQQANASPGADIIQFFPIPPIRPQAELPQISETVIIDGGGYIELNGFGVVGNGLTIAAPNTVVRGLFIDSFGGSGIVITSSNNIIGGTSPGAGNVISGNGQDGIYIFSGAGNQVQGNYIGVTADGTQSLGNGDVGVEVNSSSNTIGGTLAAARNVISGNTTDGVWIRGGTGNQVQGNFVGVNADGTQALGNGYRGVDIGSSSNTIGGTSGTARNVISGNKQDGIWIYSGSGNQVQGNYIGVGIDGAKALGNGYRGIEIANSSNNIIGGTSTEARNVISGNSQNGVWIQSGTGNQVQGNYIGTDFSGTKALGNSLSGITISSSSNVIGGTSMAARNVISGNTQDGIWIQSGSGNQVQGNYIGTDYSGATALRNDHNGIVISSSNNIIGGTSEAARNVISGNGRDDVSSSIGYDGVSIIGGTGNQIQGNYIGVSADGTKALANADVGVEVNSSSNTIGGTAEGARNVISGNSHSGIWIRSGTGNQVQGNHIGTNPRGTLALGNGYQGVHIDGSSNTIGGISEVARNVISGNNQNGIWVSSGTGNQVQGNSIGTNADGTQALGNNSRGVLISDSSNNFIGGMTDGVGNTIAFNNGAGVVVTGSSIGNAILRNSIFSNKGLGIDLGSNGVTPNDLYGNGCQPPDVDTGPNNLQNSPIIYFNSSGPLKGRLISTPNSAFTVQFFSAARCDSSTPIQGEKYLGEVNVTTDSSGNSIEFSVPSPLAGQTITATATDQNNNTSEFSQCASVGLELFGIEVTQGIQNLANSVGLIQDRPTVARVYVRSPSGSVSNVAGRLIATHTVNGVCTPLGSTGLKSITALNDPRRINFYDSFYFRLPATWLNGEIALQFQSESHFITCNEPDTNKDCKVEKLNFKQSSIPEVRLIPIIWEAGGEPQVPSNFDLEKAAREIMGTFPISKLRASISEDLYLNVREQPTTFPQFWDIVRLLLVLHEADCGVSAQTCKQLYLGILTNPPISLSGGEVIGIANNIPGDVAAAYLTSLTPPHELGHTVGREHPDRDPKNPVKISNDRSDSGFFGFDLFNASNQLILGPNTYDLMKHANRRWPSKYTYEEIGKGLESRFGASASALSGVAGTNQLQATGEQVVLVSGFVSPNQGTGDIRSVYILNSSASLPVPDPGPYAIRLENSQGQAFATYSFKPSEPSEGTTAVFALRLPWNTNTVRIVLLRNGQEIHSRRASANAPAVTVNYPNGGESLSGATATLRWSSSDPDKDTLSYLIQYSRDAGMTWQTLAVDYPSTTYTLNLSRISGTDQGLLRILASDGFHTAQDQSDATFKIARQAPQTSIFSPENNSLYFGDETIILEGSAYDTEDGQLDGAALTWSSNLNGALGNGTSLEVKASTLAEGTHTITLTARDKDGKTGSSNVTVKISRMRPVFPPTLSVAPLDLNFEAISGSGQTGSDVITIRNSGDGQLTWSASADQSWIRLGSTTGAAPANISVTADLSGLQPGQYAGHITITAPGAEKSPQTVDVIFDVVQAGPTCTYSISPTSQSIGAGGGNGSVNVTAPSGCNWTASSNAAWITITSSGSGSGNGAVAYSVAANTSTNARTGTLIIAGQTFTVTQAGAVSPTQVTLAVSVACTAITSINVSITPGGNFTTPVSRTYTKGQSVRLETLTAEINQCGMLPVITPFYRWIVNNSPYSIGQRAINLTLDQDTTAIAEYRFPINYEADVAPRGAANGAVTAADWVQVGRFANSVDIPNNSNEFQRADCAPRSTLGDGRITVSDWVQAGRYAAGLDPLTPVGGPTSPSTGLAIASSDLINGAARNKESRTVRASGGISGQDRSVSFEIELDAKGNENALGFSLNFDSAKWRFVSAAIGRDASDATLVVKANEAIKGQIGIALALPPGRTFVAGRRRVVVVTLIPTSDGPVAPSAIEFGDWPIARDVVDTKANSLGAAWIELRPCCPTQQIKPTAASRRKQPLRR